MKSKVAASLVLALLVACSTTPAPNAKPAVRMDAGSVLLRQVRNAGAMGNESTRLGDSAIAEIERLAAGRPLAHGITHEDLRRIA